MLLQHQSILVQNAKTPYSLGPSPKVILPILDLDFKKQWIYPTNMSSYYVLIKKLFTEAGEMSSATVYTRVPEFGSCHHSCEKP